MTSEVILSALGLAGLPAGWAINKIVQHERKIAVLEQIATDIRDSLRVLSDAVRDTQRASSRTHYKD
jgi:hypothetical protein